MKILVTGATGFVGSRVIKRLQSNKKNSLVAVVRKKNTKLNNDVGTIIISDLNEFVPWEKYLTDVDVIIHTAARVHVLNDTSKDPFNEFRKVNVEGTLALAREAAKSGVKRFIFLSSIKVNGEFTCVNEKFTASDTPKPKDFYGMSKLEAEIELFKLAENTALEVVCIRPVLVYGAGVKANFYNLMKLIDIGIPLPFGNVSNVRSFVSIENLVDLIYTCISHSQAINKVFLVSDDDDLSITELLTQLSRAFNKKSRFISVSPKILKLIFKITGNSALSQKLLDNLQVDISATKKTLNWSPPFSVFKGLQKTVAFYKDSK